MSLVFSVGFVTIFVYNPSYFTQSGLFLIVEGIGVVELGLSNLIACRRTNLNRGPLHLRIRVRHQAVFQLIPVIIFSVAFGLLSAAVVMAAGPVRIESTWRVQAMDDSQQDQSVQRYNQRYYLQWSPRVTRAINFNGVVDYNQGWATGQGTRETMAPNVNIDVQNDLFLAHLSGSLNNIYNSDSRDLLTRSWETGMENVPEGIWMPRFELRFGQSWEDDGENIPTIDTGTNWHELLADWQYLKRFKLSYSYYQSRNTDDARHNESDQKRHLGRFDYMDRFWNNRVMVHFSQQINQTDTDFNALVDESGFAEVPVTVSRGLAGQDATPETGALSSNPSLIDGNLTVAAYSINFGEPVNIGIQTDLQTVDRIYVSTTRDDGLLIADTNALTWDLYSSNDGVTWQRRVINASTVFNAEKYRFEVDAGGVKAVYIKLVVTGWPSAIVVRVSEISAYRLLSGSHQVSIRQRTTNYKTNMGLGLMPTTDTRMNYSLSWEQSDISEGNDRDRLYQSAGFQWLCNRYFQPSVTIGSTVTGNSGTADTENRNYALTIVSRPLDTLESSLGLSRYESYEDNQKRSTGHSVNWNNSAILYPGLTSELDLYLNMNNNEETGNTSSSVGTVLSLTSRMRDDLVAELRTSYNGNNVGFVGSDTEAQSGGRTSLQLNYRPSDMLSLLLNGNLGYGDNGDRMSSILFDSRLAVLRTNKTHVTLGYSLNAIQVDTIQTLDGNWSWDLSQYLSLGANANYLIKESGDSWNINGTLNARF